MTKDKTEAGHLEAGRWLFAQGTQFRFGVVAPDGLPATDQPEIAFAGRSNVGKSSLINALTNTKALARISAKPGRTQELNFFALAPHCGTADDNGAAWLVDLPGYGYARQSKSKMADRHSLLFQYLHHRAPLRRVFVLVDARHGFKPSDMDMLSDLDTAGLSYQIVLTKTDKLKPPALAACEAATQEILAKRPAAHPVLLPTSSKTGAGVAQVRAEIAALVDMVALGYKA